MRSLARRSILSVLFLLSAAVAGGAERRALTLDDLASMREVSDPRISPDGTQVVYTVERPDLEKDEGDQDVWRVAWDGGEARRLTTSEENEHAARFSPDGRWISFLSSRDHEAETDQLWLLPRGGGEAERVTDLEGGVRDYDWSPDGRRLVLVVDDADPEKKALREDEDKTPAPIVIDRFQFKQDGAGYLRAFRSHLWLLDLETREVVALTSGDHDELLPAWSPDGRSIAFVTKRGPDPDRHDDWNVWSMEARPGAEGRRLTTNPGADCNPDDGTRPAWSPDGRWIAYLHGGPQERIWYAVQQIGVVPAAGGEAILPTAGLDRNVTAPRFSADGRSLFFLLEDDGEQVLARVSRDGGPIERLTRPGEVVRAFDVGPDDRVAMQLATPSAPDEIHALGALGDDATRALSRHNDAWLAEVALAPMERIAFHSKDGTEIHGWTVRPPDAGPDRELPAVLRIHGGPTSQYPHAFRFDWQLFAAHGYQVLGVNPRGSSGRGEAFAAAIWAAWGSVDVEDVLAGVDHLVARGQVDPDRLALGGWSYGGMLTDYVIASDTRFKAAISGAGIADMLAGYGVDHYIRDWEHELGRPWEHPDRYLTLSYPFLHADRIVTPTLFVAGEDDVNVPRIGSEQMYQALRSLGVPTRLVIYPGESHGIGRPSYRRDLLQRYLDWYGRYVPGAAETPAP